MPEKPRVMAIGWDGKDAGELIVKNSGDGYVDLLSRTEKHLHLGVTLTDIHCDPFLRTMKRDEPRVPLKIEAYSEADPCCQICGEPADDEMGEFRLPDWAEVVWLYAHGQCGLDNNLPLA